MLNHGYIDPAYYVTGQGLAREQDALARAGFVVLHTDYRNHAFSDDDPTAERRMRLGYTVDVVNAVKALRRADLPVDDRRRLAAGLRFEGQVLTFDTLAASRPAGHDNDVARWELVSERRLGGAARSGLTPSGCDCGAAAPASR